MFGLHIYKMLAIAKGVFKKLNIFTDAWLRVMKV